MGIYRGPGGSGDATNDASSETRLAVEARDAAIAAKVAAETAQAAAELAETHAETAETNAETAETNAETAATNAANSASSASTSATNAANSATAAQTAETNAETAETNAETSATSAASSASAASTSATNAASSASTASTAATNAGNSATAAAASASSASSSASTATTQASNASTSATNAASSASSASSSASTATTQAGIATTQATNASNSASAAATSATNASNSASAASTSASNAATSATAAQTAETNAETAQAAAESARDATLAAYDSFDDRYLGVKSSDPTLDNDGNALVAGSLYFSSTDNAMKVYTGSAWVAAYVSGAGTLLAANNLSDVSSVSSARTNLGLAIGTNVQAWDADLDTWATKTAPSGTVVGTSDTQTLTNKTLTDPTINGSVATTGLNFDSNTLVIDAANNRVGIGNAAPAHTVDIQSASGGTTARLRNTTGNFIDFIETSGSSRTGYIGTTNGTNFVIHNDKAGQMQFDTNNTERMRITDTGNVGIGTSSPNARFQVTNSVAGTSPTAILENTSTTLSDAVRLNFLTADDGTAGRTRALIEAVSDGTNNGRLSFYTRLASAVTERMRITSTGNVGIGTSSPSYALDVNGVIKGNNLLALQAGTPSFPASGLGWEIYNNSSTDNFLQSYNRTGSVYMNSVYNALSHQFRISGTERMRLDSSGNLGLGVTPSAWATTLSQKAIQISNAGALASLDAGSGNRQVNLINNAFFDGSNYKYLVSDSASYYQQLAGQHRWQTAASGTAGNNITFTQAMTLDASGNLGIGTSSPTMYWSGSNKGLSIGGTTNGAEIDLKTSGSTSTSYMLQDVAYNFNIGNSGAYPVRFYTSDTERMRITSGGDLLIKTTTVDGNAGVGVKIGSDGADGFLQIVGSTSNNANVTYRLYSTGAGAYRFYVGYGGLIYATSTSISALSDATLKTNVKDLETGLTEVMALKPRRFDWINGDATNVAGFVAQEVEEVLPELVSDYQYNETETKKSLKMGDILPTLVKAIQEQQAIITEQSLALQDLKARIETLESK